MKLSNYVWLWFFITLLMGFEYLSLNGVISFGTLIWLKKHSILPTDFNLSPQPGKPISYWLGWAGFGTMLLTNLYVFRKRASFLQKSGKLTNWLDFHIFCGLIGPTWIVFHSNFKVNGLVAISFWCMVISASSGVIGRYFYIQLIEEKSDLEKKEKFFEEKLSKALSAFTKLPIEEWPDDFKERVKKAKANALHWVGADAYDDEKHIVSTPIVLLTALFCDIRLFFILPKPVIGTPSWTSHYLKEYGLAVRHKQFLTPFHKLMGYWHTFHLPFAYFMYLTAIIHIIFVTLFRVN